ncbi:tetratricopeptide repeat protein [Parasphingopyxis algicola]|uniref:winged helix-turn-helix domain-containing tetratricopeptide repeat protein n=1 Tax=Parasphingopyxis algicola TaxID=2026624 RepID=UPI0015A3C3C7|nr:winged helix-turn-helix domain-containing protein [Parasphingopyxis algicola]QLC25225.1 tetratricopeptide repeat protein [Parasphingopyxis algicola]
MKFGQYKFDEFELDTERFELRRNGERIFVQPQPMALLILLIENRHRLLDKDEIIESLWAGRVMSESALSSQIKALRKLLGDDGRRQRFIRTIYGKGFRFVGDVQTQKPSVLIRTPEDSETIPVQQDIIGERPSIAVLPFRTIGKTEADNRMADALPEELIRALSQLRWLFVIARGSSFQFPSTEPDLQYVRSKLGVRYYLSGAVEIIDDHISLMVELADAQRGSVVWADKLETKLGGIHEVRQHIVANVVSSVDFHIPAYEARRARLTVPEELNAWQAYHLGISHTFRLGEPNYEEAERCFRRAIELDPQFGRAHAGLAQIIWWEMMQRSRGDLEDMRSAMTAAAQKAIAYDEMDPFANLVRGGAAWLSGSPQEGAVWFNRAIEFCPNYSSAYNALAGIHALTGDPDPAIEHIDKAIALSPLDPWLHTMYAIRAASHIAREEFDDAALWSTKAMQLPHDSLVVAGAALISFHQAGHRDEADRMASRIREYHPGMDRAGVLSALPIFSELFLKHFNEVFREYKFD